LAPRPVGRSYSTLPSLLAGLRDWGPQGGQGGDGDKGKGRGRKGEGEKEGGARFLPRLK